MSKVDSAGLLKMQMAVELKEFASEKEKMGGPKDDMKKRWVALKRIQKEEAAKGDSKKELAKEDSKGGVAKEKYNNR